MDAGTKASSGRTTDAAHAARTGAMQAVTIAVQGLLTVTHVLLARLFGQAVFGSYQTCLAILEMLTRGGTGGADKAIVRYVSVSRASDDADGVRRALGTALRFSLGIGGT